MFTMTLKIGDSDAVPVTLGRKAPGTVEKPANVPAKAKKTRRQPKKNAIRT